MSSSLSSSRVLWPCCSWVAWSPACCPQTLRVFLEAEGSLRSNPQWLALKPKVLTPIQATNRLLRTIVGARKTAPTPSEVVQPAAANRDIYRLLHENLQQLRGSFKHSPLNAEVSTGCGAGGRRRCCCCQDGSGAMWRMELAAGQPATAPAAV